MLLFTGKPDRAACCSHASFWHTRSIPLLRSDLQ